MVHFCVTCKTALDFSPPVVKIIHFEWYAFCNARARVLLRNTRKSPVGNLHIVQKIYLIFMFFFLVQGQPPWYEQCRCIAFFVPILIPRLIPRLIPKRPKDMYILRYFLPLAMVLKWWEIGIQSFSRGMEWLFKGFAYQALSVNTKPPA